MYGQQVAARTGMQTSPTGCVATSQHSKGLSSQTAAARPARKPFPHLPACPRTAAAGEQALEAPLPLLLPLLLLLCLLCHAAQAAAASANRGPAGGAAAQQPRSSGRCKGREIGIEQVWSKGNRAAQTKHRGRQRPAPAQQPTAPLQLSPDVASRPSVQQKKRCCMAECSATSLAAAEQSCRGGAAEPSPRTCAACSPSPRRCAAARRPQQLA